MLRFTHPILDALNDGRIIRQGVAQALRILGVLAAVGGVYLLVVVLKASFQLTTEGTIGGLILAVLLGAAALAVLQVLFYRAQTVADLGESPFTVIPILSVVCRTLGEIYALLGVMMGVGGCVFIWFAKADPSYFLDGLRSFFPAIGAEGSFLGGLTFLITMVLVSFAVLLMLYALAESIVVLVDIARNIRRLVPQTPSSSQRSL
jgi:hypothetical protein